MTSGIGTLNLPPRTGATTSTTTKKVEVANDDTPQPNLPPAEMPMLGQLGGLAPLAGTPSPPGTFKIGDMGRTPQGGFLPPPGTPPNGGMPGLGGVFGAPMPQVAPEGTERARAALQSGAQPAADHPMMVHTNQVREGLAAEGLPTSAEGVQVHVLGENPFSPDPAERDHGPQITRAIAGPAGPAQGAEVHLANPRQGPFFPPPGATMESQTARINREISVSNGTASYDQAMQHGVDRMEGMVHNSATELQQLRERLPADRTPRTVMASMSWGQSPFREGVRIANTAIGQGNESQLVRDVNARREAAGEPALDVTQDKDAAAFRGTIIEGLVAELGTDESKARMGSARERLATEAAAAREAGILPIASAGNEHHQNLPEGWDVSAISGVPGVLSVGASDVKDPTDRTDDELGRFSARGAQVTAPGVNMPIGSADEAGRPENLNGTSFSAPYVAGVGALMVKANPDITPDQVESILTSGAANRDLPGTTRDGAGILDPVAAVRMARDLRD